MKEAKQRVRRWASPGEWWLRAASRGASWTPRARTTIRCCTQAGVSKAPLRAEARFAFVSAVSGLAASLCQVTRRGSLTESAPRSSLLIWFGLMQKKQSLLGRAAPTTECETCNTPPPCPPRRNNRPPFLPVPACGFVRLVRVPCEPRAGLLLLPCVHSICFLTSGPRQLKTPHSQARARVPGARVGTAREADGCGLEAISSGAGRGYHHEGFGVSKAYVATKMPHTHNKSTRAWVFSGGARGDTL